jgi:purine-binding chemotaxis protein CheW
MTTPDRIAPRDAAAGEPRELLVFRMAHEEYALDIRHVQEIRTYEAVTRVANTPRFIKGVTNLRGTIVPIVDMRIKFGLGDPVYDQFTVAIVLNLGRRVIGIVVDGVSEVVTVNEGAIHPAPALASLETEYLTGLVQLDDRLVIVIDILRLLSTKDMALVEQAVA